MQCAELCMCESVCVKEREKAQKEERDRGKENLEIYVYGHNTQDNSMCFYKLE